MDWESDYILVIRLLPCNDEGDDVQLDALRPEESHAFLLFTFAVQAKLRCLSTQAILF